MPPPRYPVAAPLLLAAAGAAIIIGTEYSWLAPLAFGWAAPLFFFCLNLVMFSKSLPSALLLLGSVLSLTSSTCKAFGFASAPICHEVTSGLPGFVRPMLAFSGPFIIALRAGLNPVLLSWLGSTGVALLPAILPTHVNVVTDVLDGWRPGIVSGALTLLCSALMVYARWSSGNDRAASKPPPLQPPPPTARPPVSPLTAYGCVWAAHTLLQMHSQAFLFPPGARLPLFAAICALILLGPSRGSMAVVIILRNCARVASMPFVWDSEYWLALTDLTVMVSMYGSSTATEQDCQRLSHVGPIVRLQLSILYAAAAFFKLNTSFLNVTTSCAPIFGLSLLERVPSLAAAIAASESLVRIFASAMPCSVVGAEAAIAVLLAIEKYARRGVALALLFHLAIALTPPPNGVPTFSCVAASRLILCIGDDGTAAAHALRKTVDLVRSYAGVLVAVAAVLLYASPRTDAAIALFVLLMALNLAALSHLQGEENGDGAERADRSKGVTLAKAAAVPHGLSRRTAWLGGAAFIYGFALPILGVQEIGSCTMFANMRLVQGGSNHLLGVPTGFLQWWNADAPVRPFGGGVVRVEHTSSAFLNKLYPGEITTLIAPRTRELLRRIGHATRQFNPKARRVLGRAIRERMPHWEPHSGAPFVKYTVPALELRRLLQEARQDAAATGIPFDLTYTRLHGARGDEAWRSASHGTTVRLRGDDGNGRGSCRSRNEVAGRRAGWTTCAPDELALLPAPTALELKFSLFYPYSIVPETDTDLVCNY